MTRNAGFLTYNDQNSRKDAAATLNRMLAGARRSMFVATAIRKAACVRGTMSLAGDAFVTAGRADAIAPSATMPPRAIATPPRMNLDRPRTVDAYTPSSTGTARIAMRYFRNTGPGCVGGGDLDGGS